MRRFRVVGLDTGLGVSAVLCRSDGTALQANAGTPAWIDRGSALPSVDGVPLSESAPGVYFSAFDPEPYMDFATYEYYVDYYDLSGPNLVAYDTWTAVATSGGGGGGVTLEQIEQSSILAKQATLDSMRALESLALNMTPIEVPVGGTFTTTLYLIGTNGQYMNDVPIESSTCSLQYAGIIVPLAAGLDYQIDLIDSDQFQPYEDYRFSLLSGSLISAGMVGAQVSLVVQVFDGVNYSQPVAIPVHVIDHTLTQAVDHIERIVDARTTKLSLVIGQSAQFNIYVPAGFVYSNVAYQIGPYAGDVLPENMVYSVPDNYMPSWGHHALIELTSMPWLDEGMLGMQGDIIVHGTDSLGDQVYLFIPFDVSTISSGGITPIDVWSYRNRSLTTPPFVIPVVTQNVYNGVEDNPIELHIVRGDSYDIPLQWVGDMTAYTARLAVKVRLTDTTYVVSPKTITMAYDAVTDTTAGSGVLLATDTTSIGEYVGEVELTLGLIHKTTHRFIIKISEDVID